MKPVLAFAAGLAACIIAGPVMAQSNTGGTNQGAACPFDHPRGCYINQNAKSPVRSVYFFDNGRGQCGAHVRICPQGRSCTNRTVHLTPAGKGNGKTQRPFFTSRKAGSVQEMTTYSFSGRVLGGGIHEHMTADIAYTNESGKTTRSQHPYRASPDGC
ncbi:hypothetical protein [Amorphus orientalis]|uniref:Uncharacterized protein n=1 Tax=Amorphus orientalis TaxID=649198 RepID=A0AAE3VMI8_9HYPH|nr:hypothetical protein [Amorphus orientalis]MDQ0314692.1 hypothetical protein [Amorphus orientalis]